MNNQSEQKELHVSTESRCTDSRRTPGGSRLCRFNRWRVKEAKHSNCCLFLLLSSLPEIRSSKESNSGGFCSLSGLWSGTQTAGTFFIPNINVCFQKTWKHWRRAGSFVLWREFFLCFFWLFPIGNNSSASVGASVWNFRWITNTDASVCAVGQITLQELVLYRWKLSET